MQLNPGNSSKVYCPVSPVSNIVEYVNPHPNHLFNGLVVGKPTKLAMNL